MHSHFSIKISIVLIMCVLITSSLSIQPVSALDSKQITEKFVVAEKHMLEGEYKEAVTIFDDLLETSPTNIKILNLKGIAQSNLGYHKQSMIQFYKILEIDPDNVIALAGIVVNNNIIGIKLKKQLSIISEKLSIISEKAIYYFREAIYYFRKDIYYFRKSYLIFQKSYLLRQLSSGKRH